VEGPDDVTFGPDGSLYWTSLMTGNVGRLTPTGELTLQMVAPGVNPITFSDDGRLFVALDFFGEGLYELDPDLSEEPRLIIEKLGWLNGMDFGPDGLLYGPICNGDNVVRIDVDAATMATVADGFGVPAAAKFDSQGRLHVVDQSGPVYVLDVATGAKTVLTELNPDADNLAFDSSGRLFVSHAADGSIQEIGSDGSLRTVTPGGMINPGGLVAVRRTDGGESVYVGDVFALREYDGRSGEARRTTYLDVMSLKADDEHILASSWFENSVKVIDPATEVVLGTMYDFAVPLNAIRFRGDYVVCEVSTGSVVLAPKSDPSPANRTTLAQGLAVPLGLAKTDDDLFVSDWGTGMVLQLIADGDMLSEPVPVMTGLEFPEGMAVQDNRYLLVVETGTGRLLRMDLGSKEVSTVAEGLSVGEPGLEGGVPCGVKSSVTVGPSGAIYVTGEVDNVIYRIEPGP
jgi:sugar lactone lactonase YvrE